jgi:hypothetical protein
VGGEKVEGMKKSLEDDYTNMDDEQLAMWMSDRRALHIERLSRLLMRLGHWHRLREHDDWTHHLTLEYEDRQYELEVFAQTRDPEGWWWIRLRDGDEYGTGDTGRTIGRISVSDDDNAPLLAALEKALPPADANLST